MSNNLKIAISGKSGCGNSSVSQIVAQRLSLRLINYTFKSIAKERGIAFEEVCQLAENDTSFDFQVDKRQVEMANEGNCVLGSRLAIWLLEDAALKVYLEASAEKRARRIKKREGGDLDTVYREMIQRDDRDRLRYMKLYKIDIDKYQIADLVIDTENKNQYQIAEMIIRKITI